MKVLLLCMAFAAVSLAMPVAEQDVPIASPAVAEVKSEEVKPQVESQPAPIEEKVEQIPDVKAAEKPVEPEAKIATPAEDVKAVIPEASAEDPQPDKKPEAPEVKTAPVSDLSESKPEDKSAEEVKSEEKPDVKVAPVEEATQAKVEEVAVGISPKSDIPDEKIDVVSAVKNVAAVADDVVDPAAIIPVPASEPQAVDSSKSATPEEKKADAETEAPKIDVAKSSLPEDIKPVASKPEDKEAPAVSAEAPAVSDAAPALKAVDSDDASRVVRDAAEEKPVEEKPKVESKAAAVADVVKEEVKPVEPVKAEDAQPAVEKSAVIIAKSVEVKDGKSVESPKIAEQVPVAPAEAADVKPEAKANEQALGDAPAAKNSDESNESSEKNASGESSEESDEKPSKS